MESNNRLFVFQHQDRYPTWKPMMFLFFFLIHFLLDRCDAKVSCYRIRDERHEDGASFRLRDEVFTKCTTFNIHLEAADLGNRVLRDEISLANKWVIKNDKIKRFCCMNEKINEVGGSYFTISGRPSVG